MKTDGGHSVVEVHDGVNKGVEDDKDPNRLSLITDTGPHGDHSTRVMVGL